MVEVVEVVGGVSHGGLRTEDGGLLPLILPGVSDLRVPAYCKTTPPSAMDHQAQASTCSVSTESVVVVAVVGAVAVAVDTTRIGVSFLLLFFAFPFSFSLKILKSIEQTTIMVRGLGPCTYSGG